MRRLLKTNMFPSTATYSSPSKLEASDHKLWSDEFLELGNGSLFYVYKQDPSVYDTTTMKPTTKQPLIKQIYLNRKIGVGPKDLEMRIIRNRVSPNSDGDFTHLEEGTLEFDSAHTYAVVRQVYDMWRGTIDSIMQEQEAGSGFGLTHRVAVHFNTDVTVHNSDTPRVKAEPVVNQWLSGQLPSPEKIACQVTYLKANNELENVFVTQADLGLAPLDMLYIFNPDNLEARSELEDRVRLYVMQNPELAPQPDTVLKISYTIADTNQFSFFEIAPLIRSLRALLLRSRPLRPTDMMLPTEASIEASGVMQLEKSRVAFLETDLKAINNAKLQPLLTQLTNVFPAEGPITETILANIDNYIETMIDICKTLSLYGLQQTGFGIFLETKGGIYKNLRQLSEEIKKRWQGRLDEYNALITHLPLEDRERISVLLKAEQLISTSSLDLADKTIAQIQAEVEAKKAQFDTKRSLFEGFSKTTKTKLYQVLNDFNTLLIGPLPYTDFDSQPVLLTDIHKAVTILAQDIYTRAQQLANNLSKLFDGIKSKLDEYDLQADRDKQLLLLTDAAKAVFGEEFLLVPSFLLSEKQGNELAKAYTSKESLLDHQKTIVGNSFPIDDWLYGVARVREKMHHLENLLFLTEALQTKLPDLQPIQLPFETGVPWLALEFPEAALEKMKRENLLYTSLYAGDFNQMKNQSGLLLDEWTEVIPAKTETTGITFHFDKPNSEPPQTILLATPPKISGAWQWQDLVDTLHSTLDRARIRGVEPQQLDKTDLSVFLPATILATTWRPITIATDLAIVNDFINKVDNL